MARAPVFNSAVFGTVLISDLYVCSGSESI